MPCDRWAYNTDGRTAAGSSACRGASGGAASLLQAACLATPSDPLEGSNPSDRKRERS
jgi:hypothetical protein